MDSQHLRQSLKEQTFHLYNRAMHPELFRIYESRHFYQGEYEVVLWLTGHAHVVSIFTDGYCMTELICPPEQLLPKRGLIEKFTLTKNKKYQCTWPNGMVYLINSEIETMSSNVYQQTHRELRKTAGTRGMYVEFPENESETGTPFSYLDYEASKDELQLYTYHALPEQQTMLRTQSLFTLKKKKRRTK